MIPCSQVCEIPHFCEKKNCTLDTTRTGSGNSKNSIYKDNTFRRITPLLRRTQKHLRQLRLPLDNQLEDVMNAEKNLLAQSSEQTGTRVQKFMAEERRLGKGIADKSVPLCP